MRRRDRLEAGVALAMLPVGVTLGVLSALGAVGLLFCAAAAFLWAVFAGAVSWWMVLWCFVGGAVLAWAAVRSIEIVSAFDWRPLPGVLGAIAATAAASPFWW